MSERDDRPSQESTTFGRPILMFYACCTLFSTLFAIAASLFIVFSEHELAIPVAIVCSILGVVAMFGAIRFLQIARGER